MCGVFMKGELMNENSISGSNLRSTADGIRALISYGLDKNLIGADDRVYASNLLIDVMRYEPSSDFSVMDLTANNDSRVMNLTANNDSGVMDLTADNDSRVMDLTANKSLSASDTKEHTAPVYELEDILKYLLDDAVARGVTEDGTASRDLFDTRLMGCLTPRPSEVIRQFNELYKDSPQKATDYFYALSRDSDYIRTYRVKKDLKWITKTKYGDLDITVNLSKPEKDPKAIAAALTKKHDSYPKCLLCPENVGYAGRLDHPARETIRLIPLTLGGKQWYMQYSPYVYYNEHCIVLSGEHVPMKIDHDTFVRLLEFTKLFPHYTIGSNADLPIVGGSILTHEHFQGGRYTFAMARAGIREALSFAGYEDVTAGIVEWPMSVIRLDSDDPCRLTELADTILTSWRNYSDPSVDILAATPADCSSTEQIKNGASKPDAEHLSSAKQNFIPHNTITPIARRRGGMYELDLVLRNNRTTDEYPLGIFHPHNELHHIKKENIGLIEVMGLAVLPSRLLGEMEQLKKALRDGTDVSTIPAISSHAAWTEEIIDKHPELSYDYISSGKTSDDDIDKILRDEIGIVFSKVLEHCGVFKDTREGSDAFHRFTNSIRRISS